MLYCVSRDQVFRHEKLQSITQELSLHLVEASHALSSIQQHTLQATPIPPPDHTHTVSPYKTGCVEDIPVSWYAQLKDVPQGLVTPT